jgi:uroporphyrinogen decarboxylase
MLPRDYVLEQMAHRETSPVPFTLWFKDEVIERLNRHYGSAEWRSRLPVYQSGCTPLAWDRRQRLPDGRYRDVYGTIWRDDRLADHVERPALSEPILRPGVIPAFESLYDADRLAKCRQDMETCTAFRQATAANPGLFERTWMLRGFEDALTDPIWEPAFYEELLDRLTELHARSVEVCLTLPVDAVNFGDDWGDQNGVTMGPELWRKWMKPRYAKLYGMVKAAGKLVTHHSCGSVADILGDLIDIGLDAINPFQPEPRGMNPYELKKRFGSNITFWGGLGSQTTIPFGTPKSIRAEVGRLCREVGRGGGFLLGPAKALREETPTENALAVIDAFLEQR